MGLINTPRAVLGRVSLVQRSSVYEFRCCAYCSQWLDGKTTRGREANPAIPFKIVLELNLLTNLNSANATETISTNKAIYS